MIVVLWFRDIVVVYGFGMGFLFVTGLVTGSQYL